MLHNPCHNTYLFLHILKILCVSLFYLWGHVLREYKDGEDLNFLHPQVSLSLRFLKQFTHCFFGMCAVLHFLSLMLLLPVNIKATLCVSKNVLWPFLLNWKFIVKMRTMWDDDITHEVSMRKTGSDFVLTNSQMDSKFIMSQNSTAERILWKFLDFLNDFFFFPPKFPGDFSIYSWFKYTVTFKLITVSFLYLFVFTSMFRFQKIIFRL